MGGISRIVLVVDVEADSVTMVEDVVVEMMVLMAGVLMRSDQRDKELDGTVSSPVKKGDVTMNVLDHDGGAKRGLDFDSDEGLPKITCWDIPLRGILDMGEIRLSGLVPYWRPS